MVIVVKASKRASESLSHVRLFATPQTGAYQAPPSMGFFQARKLEWVAIPFSRGSNPGDQTHVSRIAGRHFTIWATRETPKHWARPGYEPKDNRNSEHVTLEPSLQLLTPFVSCLVCLCDSDALGLALSCVLNSLLSEVIYTLPRISKSGQ